MTTCRGSIGRRRISCTSSVLPCRTRPLNDRPVCVPVFTEGACPAIAGAPATIAAPPPSAAAPDFKTCRRVSRRFWLDVPSPFSLVMLRLSWHSHDEPLIRRERPEAEVERVHDAGTGTVPQRAVRPALRLAPYGFTGEGSDLQRRNRAGRLHQLALPQRRDVLHRARGDLRSRL